MKLIQSKYWGYLVLIFFIFFLYWSFGPMKNIEKKLINATGNQEMLDLKPLSSADAISAYVNKIGQSGRDVLKEMYTYQDFIYPISYGLFFLTALLFFIARVVPKNKRWLFLALLPLLMMGADYIENFSILKVLENPTATTSAAFYIGKITLIKWIIGGMTIFLLMIFMTIFGYKKAFRKKRA